MSDKCIHCGGTGYGSAARSSGNPNMIGIWKCEYCCGSGKRVNFTISPEELKKMKSRLDFMFKRSKLTKEEETE